jgi:transcriptional regulator
MITGETNLFRGTLDVLVLKALALGELHGLGVAKRVEQITRGAFEIGPGSLFPALHRLEAAGSVAARWGPSETNRRAKYYHLTAAGRRRLAAEIRQWSRFAGTINYALEAT